jgi:ATP-dependent Clp protease protease subunit
MEFPFFNPLDQKLFESRIVQISGGVGSKLAHDVNKVLLALERDDKDKPVYLFINSPGGEITSGFSIFDTARFIQPEVITVVTGLAASMGSLIALCAEKKNRLAFPNAKFLIHQPLISGLLTGSASDIEIHANDIVKTKQKINEIYSKETGRPMDEIAAATDRDNWMDATEALEFGLISRVVGSRAEI